MDINKLIDHTCLKPDASLEKIKNLCEEARQYNFKTVCVNPCFVPVCKELLKDTEVGVCTVVGFPLGATLPHAKAFEAAEAIKFGADEIDMVINVSMAKEHNYGFVKNEIALVKKACGVHALKVIIEVCLLENEEIVEVCKAAKEAGADFVKTSTGFSYGGATAEAVALMRKTVGEDMGVKAAGGIRSAEDAKVMINAGANRIGTSSGATIVANFVEDAPEVYDSEEKQEPEQK